MRSCSLCQVSSPRWAPPSPRSKLIKLPTNQWLTVITRYRVTRETYLLALSRKVIAAPSLTPWLNLMTSNVLSSSWWIVSLCPPMKQSGLDRILSSHLRITLSVFFSITWVLQTRLKAGQKSSKALEWCKLFKITNKMKNCFIVNAKSFKCSSYHHSCQDRKRYCSHVVIKLMEI